MKTPKEQWQELQEQNLELLKAQQEAYLSGIRMWRAQLAGSAPGPQGSPQLPTFPMFTGQTPGAGQGSPAQQNSNFPSFPSPEEVAEINKDYMEKINQQQQEFLSRLSALATEQG